MSGLHTQSHNVLFDAPIREDYPIVLENGHVIRNIESIYDRKILERCFQMYMGTLLCQYITIFCSVPFDGIDNRPPIVIFASLYTLVLFSVCACFLPLGGTSIPTKASVKFLIAIVLIESVGLVFSVVAVIMCLNAKNMTSYSYDSALGQTVAIDVTTYVQVITCFSMFLHCLGVIFSFTNAILSTRSLKRFVNKIDRRTYGKNNMSLHYDLPLCVAQNQYKIYMP